MGTTRWGSSHFRVSAVEALEVWLSQDREDGRWVGWGLMRGHWPALHSSLCWRLLSHLSYYSGCPFGAVSPSHPPAVGQRSGYQCGQPPGEDKVIMLNNDSKAKYTTE